MGWRGDLGRVRGGRRIRGQRETWGIANYDELDPKAKKAARERYASISGVLPFVGDMPERAARTRQAANDYKVSKETIRQRLVAYLIWQDIGALAPKPREERELTSDERNFRWALNRLFSSKSSSMETIIELVRRETSAALTPLYGLGGLIDPPDTGGTEHAGNMILLSFHAESLTK